MLYFPRCQPEVQCLVGVLRSHKLWNMATKWCKYFKLRSYGKVVVLSSITINLSNACANQSMWGFPGGSGSKESTCNAGDRVWSLGGEDPLEKEWQPTPVFLPMKSHGQRSLAGYSPWEQRVRHDWTTNTLTFLTLDCIWKECPKIYFKGECMVITHGL